MQITNQIKRALKTMTEKINYPSAERNKVYILDVLKKYFDSSRPGDVLELASGTGQHAAYFAKHFPNLIFHPSEYEDALFKSIKAYGDDLPKKNVKPPVKIDVTKDCDTWPIEIRKFDYLINVNMIHISPFECTVGLFESAGKLLRNKGLMVTYGPYAENGVIKPQSNIDFDESLRSRDPSWGLRDICDLEKLALQYGITLIEKCDLPANNKCLVWKKNK